MKTLLSHPFRHRERLYGSPCGGWRIALMEGRSRHGSSGGVPTILTSPDTIGVVVDE